MKKQFTLLQLLAISRKILTTTLTDCDEIMEFVTGEYPLDIQRPVVLRYIHKRNPSWLKEVKKRIAKIRRKINIASYKGLIEEIKKNYADVTIEVTPLENTSDLPPLLADAFLSAVAKIGSNVPIRDVSSMSFKAAAVVVGEDDDFVGADDNEVEETKQGSVRHKLEKMLFSMGLFENQAKAIIDEALPVLDKNMTELADGYKITWNSPAEDYPDMLYSLMMLQIKPIALAWIEKNIPTAWFKQMFQ